MPACGYEFDFLVFKVTSRSRGNHVKFACFRQGRSEIWNFLFRSAYHKTIIGWGFCDIRIIKVWVRVADNSDLELVYSGYHKNLIQLLFRISRVSTICVPVRYFLSDTSLVHATMHFEIVARVLKLLRSNGNYVIQIIVINCQWRNTVHSTSTVQY